MNNISDLFSESEVNSFMKVFIKNNVTQKGWEKDKDVTSSWKKGGQCIGQTVSIALPSVL